MVISMMFEAAMWSHRGGEWLGTVSLEALECAIAHVDACLEAAKMLEGIAQQFSTEQEAEVLHARILRDFAVHRRGPTIYVVRSDLTRMYCPHTRRPGSTQPRDLYDRLIPLLMRQNKARLVVKDGKREVYGFRADS